ncbi:hypothetical protein TNCV_4450551 [Trichonephila clavipes]|nr:hypothetical protein TNCV_4450551 [Trichonephila clavipes]
MIRKKQKNIFERHRNANPTPTTSHNASQPAATEEPPGEINMEIPLPNTPQASRPGTPGDFGPTFEKTPRAHYPHRPLLRNFREYAHTA